MLCIISSGRAHECVREISGLVPCERALASFFIDFLICRGRTVVWEMSRHHAVLQVEEMEETGWCPCTKWEIGLYLHLFCSRPLFLEIYKDWNVSISWSQKSVVWLTDEKVWGHQLSRTPKAHVKIFVCPRFIQLISGVSWKRELYMQLLGGISMTPASWKSHHPVVERHWPISKLWRTLDAGLTSLFDSELHLRAAFQEPSQRLAMLNSQPAENLILYRVREDKTAGRH